MSRFFTYGTNRGVREEILASTVALNHADRVALKRINLRKQLTELLARKKPRDADTNAAIKRGNRQLRELGPVLK